MDIEKEREDFAQAWREVTGNFPYRSFLPGKTFKGKDVEMAWNLWQARAALQSQKPEPDNLMLSAVIRMPIEMAMADPISRMQFYQRAQQAMNELEALQHSCKETSQDREDAERLKWLLERFPANIAISLRCSPENVLEAIDHARRIEGE